MTFPPAFTPFKEIGEEKKVFECFKIISKVPKYRGEGASEVCDNHHYH